MTVGLAPSKDVRKQSRSGRQHHLRVEVEQSDLDVDCDEHKATVDLIELGQAELLVLGLAVEVLHGNPILMDKNEMPERWQPPIRGRLVTQIVGLGRWREHF